MSRDSEPGDTGPAPGLELGRGGGERQTEWRVEGLRTGLGSWRRRPVSVSISVLWAWVPPLLPWEGVAKPHGKAGSLLRPTPPVGERGGRPHWNGQEPELAGPRSGHGRGGCERPVEGQSRGVGGGGRSLTRPLSRAFWDFVLPSRRLSVLSACTEEGLSGAGKVIGAAGALTVPDWSCPVCRLSPLPPLTLSFQWASWRE